MQKSDQENWQQIFDHMETVVSPRGITVEQCRERLAILLKDRAVIDQRIASVERLIARGGVAPTVPAQQPDAAQPEIKYPPAYSNPAAYFMAALMAAGVAWIAYQIFFWK